MKNNILFHLFFKYKVKAWVFIPYFKINYIFLIKPRIFNILMDGPSLNIFYAYFHTYDK